MQPGAFIQVAAGFHPAARGWAGELTLAGAQERYVAPICPRNSNSRSGRDLAGAGLEVTGPNTSKMVLIMPQRTTALILLALQR